MLLRILGSFLVLSVVLSGYTQINIQWESRVDGDGSFIDKAVDLELDAAGNTYVTGTSYSGTSYDLVTVKYDSDGVELWRSAYGGVGIDEAHALSLDGSDNVIITGSRFISGTDWDIVTIKYDGVTGAELWSVINPGSGLFDYGSDVAIDGSDNVIVVGTRGFGPGDVDVNVIKYNSSGVLIWEDVFGGAGADEGTLVTTDGSQTLSNKTINASQLSGTVANARLDAQLQDVAGLSVTDGGVIVGNGSNFVLETGATLASGGLGMSGVTPTYAITQKILEQLF